MIDFTKLAGGDAEATVNPREIFFTLPKEERFAFLRDVQNEVLQEWFEKRNNKDTIIKLNVGSGKTLVGLLILQSSLNENVFPAVYVTPDKLLTEQVLEEARVLGIEVTKDAADPGFARGRKILILNVHKLFNGRSVFGVGSHAPRNIPLGSVLIDDVHACLASVRDQFGIKVDRTHPVYQEVLSIFREVLKQQSLPAFLDIENGDPQKYIEVPFWAWQQHYEGALQALRKSKDSDELRFRYDLIVDVLKQCRCIVGGQGLEIAPPCVPTDIIRSFAGAKRRTYMTATLSDDSVLITDFGAKPENIGEAITPKSAQDMGERMILIPQELNVNLTLADVKKLLRELANTYNVVVLLPSERVATQWADVADQTLLGQEVAEGVERLRKKEHVGLTALVNRYDGIDLPKDACRVLAIVDLPEVSSLMERADMAVLGESRIGVRRQIQRIEQGMGRGVRSNEDHCVVVLFGSKLTRRLLSADGRSHLTSASLAQLDLSQNLAEQLQGADLVRLREVMDLCLRRDLNWVKATKKKLLSAYRPEAIRLDEAQVALRKSFDLTRAGEYVRAANTLQEAINGIKSDEGWQAWMKVRLAEVVNYYNRDEAQRILRSAYSTSRAVTRPLETAGWEKLSPSRVAQAAAIQEYFNREFTNNTERVLFVDELAEELKFEPDTSEAFESTVKRVGIALGISSQRPEKEYSEGGPDNLWALRTGQFLIIECKNGVTSQEGISKTEAAQLALSMEWFRAKYGTRQAGIPVLVHPSRKLRRDAVAIQDMRVMEEQKLGELKQALHEFVRAVCTADTLHDQKKISMCLDNMGLSERKFLERFTEPVALRK